jgi:4-hydroxy-tetrahydrodipicolinate synthase
MDRNSVKWTGCLCAVVTPFQEDGKIDRGAFRENVKLLASEGADGFVIAGCTGEFWALTDEERAETFKLAREAVPGLPVIGNATDMLTSRSIAFARRAKELGLDGIMLTPPYYVRPSEDEIYHHYQAVSDAVKIPILVYNIPTRQAVNLTPEMVARLADVECVVAIKQSTNSFQEVSETLRLAQQKILVLPGHSVERGLPVLAMGADGYVASVETEILGREAVEIYDFAVQGRYEEARKRQFRCIELDHAVHGGVGTFPASVKAAMNLVGRPGGHAREPLLPLTAEQTKRLREVLAKLGLAVRR